MNSNITKKLERIKVLRETKGKENETLKMIADTKMAAAKQKEHEALARIYWEESLNWQHYVMNEAAKRTLI